MSFAELLAADIRLVILRCLAEDPGYSMNESVLQRALGIYGHTLSRDRIKTELRWLEEQGLIRIAEVASTLVAKLTARGSDVASGAARVDGVHKPGPR